MAKAKVNVAAFFEDALKDNGKEQITYLPIDVLDQNPDNFYSLEGIDELAGNIELIGLQQPIRVRPKEDGRYTIISGHRRREAILTIVEGGSDQFKDGIPCIIERGEASPAMRELRLIYANAATRSMTSADLSKQAERVTELLYQLKEEGVEFPGRMRDHVAEACKVSKTKLARLHAIRKNLHPDLLGYFDRNEMNEELAYQMSRLPKEAQEIIAEDLLSGKRKTLPYAWVVEHVMKNIDTYRMKPRCSAHAGLPECNYTTQHIVRSLWEPYSGCWDQTAGRNKGGICCRDCEKRESCSKACQECKDRRKLDQAIEKEKAAEKARAEEAERERQQKEFRKLRQEQAQRIMVMAEKLQMKDEAELPALHSWNAGTTIGQIRKMAAGDFGKQYFYEFDKNMIPSSTSNLQDWADTLHCSTDWLLGRSDTPEPAKVSEADTGLKWKTGTPTENGTYTVRLGIPAEETPQATCYRVISWIIDGWYTLGNGVPVKENVYRWIKLPEV